MYVSRLVYIVCVLEAVLWIQPNFALSDQRDMANLLQTQNVKFNELAQNAAKDNTLSVLQKHLALIAKEQEMVARANIEVHNSQTALFDKDTSKQTCLNTAQQFPQVHAGRGVDNKGESATAAAVGDNNKGEKNGVVPVFSSNQAYLVACCLLVASASVFMNGSSPNSETSESSVESSAIDDDDVVVEDDDDAEIEGTPAKRPRDVSVSDGDDEFAAMNAEEAKESNHGRKHARLGMHATSSVQQRSQAKKKNNCHSKNRSKGISHSHAGDETVLCSPEISLSSDASSPSEYPVSSPSPMPLASGMLNTLPPELACEFEAEHALYFHGIACPSSSSPALNMVSPVGIHSFSATNPLFDRMVAQQTQRVTAIDPALLLVEPPTPELYQQGDSFSSTVSSGQESEIDESEEVKTEVPVPLFGVAMETLVQDQCFC